MSSSSGEQTRELKAIEGEIADVRRRLARLYEVIESGEVVFKDLGQRVRELAERREKLEAHKGELEMQVAANSVEAPSIDEVRESATELSAGARFIDRKAGIHPQFCEREPGYGR